MLQSGVTMSHLSTKTWDSRRRAFLMTVKGWSPDDYALVTVVDDPQRMRGALLGFLLVFATA
jgi:hypothetical protein